jgi:hypothetical protein
MKRGWRACCDNPPPAGLAAGFGFRFEIGFFTVSEMTSTAVLAGLGQSS